MYDVYKFRFVKTKEICRRFGCFPIALRVSSFQLEDKHGVEIQHNFTGVVEALNNTFNFFHLLKMVHKQLPVYFIGYVPYT